MRKYCVLLLIIIATMATATPAAVARTRPPVDADLKQITVITYDRVGRVVPAYASEGSPAASGCLRVIVTLARRTNRWLYTLTHYKWNLSVYWCWDQARHKTFDYTSQAWFTRSDGLWHPRGDITYLRWNYPWQRGYATSGYRVWASQEMEYCVTKFGCINSEFPWAWVRAHADGTYTWDVGH